MPRARIWLMNKRVLIAVGVIAIVIAGSIWALAAARSDDAPASAPQVTRTQTATPTPMESSAPGQYVAYTAEALADTEGRVFVFFHAPWCGQCVDIDKGILAQGVPDGVTILKADFDSEQALEQQYGVTMRTTFIEIGDDGAELQRFVAYDTPTFDAVIAAMF